MKVKLKVKSLGGPGGIVTTTLTVTDHPLGRPGGRPAVLRGGGRARGEASVDATMEAAAVATFLAQGDPVRLGRALAEVYRAMERARRAALDGEDD